MNILSSKERFPKSDETGHPTSHINRELILALARTNEAPSPEEFQNLLKEHQLFLATGGKISRWQTLITDDVSGLVLAVPSQMSQSEEGEFLNKLYANFEGLSLANAQLPGVCLIGLYAPNQNFSNINFEYSLLTDAYLEGANLKGANLSGCDFSRSNLRNCDFTGANLNGCDFENCNLEGANFMNCNTQNASFPVPTLPIL